jgi:serralysin
MPSPESASPAVSVIDPVTGPRAAEIAALTDTYQWGTRVGAGVSLSYSFPWAGAGSAVFAGPGGGSYSEKAEDQAAVRFGLNAVQQAAAISALQAWAAVADIGLQRVNDSADLVGDIRFAFSSAIPAGTWGWAYGPDAAYPVGGDIWISPQVAGGGASAWVPGSRNHLSLMHEIGHALGLKHPFREDPSDPGPFLTPALDNRRHTVMTYTDAAGDLYPQAGWVDGRYDWISYQVLPDTPMPLDIAAIQHLYGPNLAYRTGNDTHSPDPTIPFFRTIWDAGGIDTLSAASFARPCTIDLREGHFSSLRFAPPTNPAGFVPTYDGTDNLAIAWGCVIENAIGGSGNDTLIGNAARNLLDGGAGLDTVIGAVARSAISLTPGAAGTWLLKESAAPEATSDTLVNIERLRLPDVSVALDLGGNAGTVASVIGSVFGKAALANPLLVGIGLHCVDALGYSTEALAGLALTARLGTGAGSGQIVDLYFVNLLGQPPDAATRAAFAALIDQGTYSAPAFGAAVAGLELTALAIGFAGLATTGLDYLPFGL